MRIENEVKLDFKDVLIKPKRSTLFSRSQVNINRQFKFKYSDRTFDGVPIFAANMDHVGTFEMASKLAEYRMCVAVHKHYSMDQLKSKWSSINQDLVFYSLGMAHVDIERLDEFCAAMGYWPHNICLDVANGYAEKFLDFVKMIREKCPNSTIMAGNVVTAEMTEALILAGADIVKVGIGPGSVCTTRVKTGVGFPQLSAIIECADAAHGLDGQVCSDGGCTVPGDVAKAFGAGADFVMLGGMLAGHTECTGGVGKDYDGSEYMVFYGMSSATAMEKYAGGVAEYRASEGKTIRVRYRGPVEVTVKDILGGLRSACTYTGARSLKELSKKTTFIRVTSQENTIFGMEK